MFDIQLKVYTTQGSMYDTQGHIDIDSIGFALNEGHISSTGNLTTDYTVTICLFLYYDDVFGYIIFVIALTILSWITLTKYKTRLMSYRDNLLLSTVIIEAF